MIYALKGFVVEIRPNYLVLDVRDVSYLLYVSHPEDYQLGELRSIYTHLVLREDEVFLVGFGTLAEKQAFNDLIKVSGIGPKTALNALSMTRPDELYQAIAAKDLRFLKKLPGIGPKAASQIILDIKGQLASELDTAKSARSDVVNALKNLGFKAAEIDRVLKQVDVREASDEEVLKAALVNLRK